MEVGLGPNEGCSAKEKKSEIQCVRPFVYFLDYLTLITYITDS
jgi:hypothetical protein